MRHGGSPPDDLQKRIEKSFFNPKDEEETPPLPQTVLNMAPQTTSYLTASLKMPPTSKSERQLARTLVFRDSLKPLYQTILISTRCLDFQLDRNNVKTNIYITLFIPQKGPSFQYTTLYPSMSAVFLLPRGEPSLLTIIPWSFLFPSPPPTYFPFNIFHYTTIIIYSLNNNVGNWYYSYSALDYILSVIPLRLYS